MIPAFSPAASMSGTELVLDGWKGGRQGGRDILQGHNPIRIDELELFHPHCPGTQCVFTGSSQVNKHFIEHLLFI